MCTPKTRPKKEIPSGENLEAGGIFVSCLQGALQGMLSSSSEIDDPGRTRIEPPYLSGVTYCLAIKSSGG